MSDPLFREYPELAEALDTLCGDARWCMTGASALLRHGDAWLFELTKPEHWQRRGDGSVVVGIGAIGGSLEGCEPILDCLHREVDEEIGAEVSLLSAEASYIVYERREVHPLHLPRRAYPRPVLLTVSENLYRRHLRPECEILAIATFLARVTEEPHLRDLYGMLTVPDAALGQVLSAEPIPLASVAAVEGVHWRTREPLPERAVLSPVWTARSLQILLQEGYPLQRGEPHLGR